jgi:hypothetical protein
MNAPLEGRMANLEDRLRRLDPTLDINWRDTCREAVELIRELRRELAKREKANG